MCLIRPTLTKIYLPSWFDNCIIAWSQAIRAINGIVLLTIWTSSDPFVQKAKSCWNFLQALFRSCRNVILQWFSRTVILQLWVSGLGINLCRFWFQWTWCWSTVPHVFYLWWYSHFRGLDLLSFGEDEECLYQGTRSCSQFYITWLRIYIC